MICFIPAAGYGKRMGKLTESIPKPLLKVGEKTFLDRTIDMAKRWGINDFVINTHYLANLIHDDIKKYNDININISFERDQILGTAGGMKTALDSILKYDEFFISINPDIIYTTDHNLIELTKSYNGKCLIFLYKIENQKKYTTLNFKNNKVYFEPGDYIYTGIAYLNFALFNGIKKNQYFDLSDIFKELSNKNELDGLIFPGEYMDLGDEKSYYDYIKTIR